MPRECDNEVRLTPGTTASPAAFALFELERLTLRVDPTPGPQEAPSGKLPPLGWTTRQRPAHELELLQGRDAPAQLGILTAPSIPQSERTVFIITGRTSLWGMGLNAPDCCKAHP